MKKLFLLAIMAILFSASLHAQQDFTGPIMPSKEEAHYQVSAPMDMAYRFSESKPCYCMPCPEKEESVVKKPVAKKTTASSGSGINIENNPTNCININLSGCATHCPQTSVAPVVNHGSGWGWPWEWNPNWSWLWPLLLLLLLSIMAYQLWRIGNRSNTNSAPPANPPSPPVIKSEKDYPSMIANRDLARDALKIASEKGSSFRYYPEGGFRVEFFPPATKPIPPATEDKK